MNFISRYFAKNKLSTYSLEISHNMLLCIEPNLLGIDKLYLKCMKNIKEEIKKERLIRNFHYKLWWLKNVICEKINKMNNDKDIILLQNNVNNYKKLFDILITKEEIIKGCIELDAEIDKVINTKSPFEEELSKTNLVILYKSRLGINDYCQINDKYFYLKNMLPCMMMNRSKFIFSMAEKGFKISSETYEKIYFYKELNPTT